MAGYDKGLRGRFASWPLASIAGLLLAASSCGSGGGLSATEVTTIPPGNATGSNLDGNYTFTSVTTSCSGSCSATIMGVPYNGCTPGGKTTINATINQAGGALTIVADGSPVNSYKGGVNSDGSFEVGGTASGPGGLGTYLSKASGTITASGVTGTAEIDTHGSGAASAINCVAEY